MFTRNLQPMFWYNSRVMQGIIDLFSHKVSRLKEWSVLYIPLKVVFPIPACTPERNPLQYLHQGGEINLFCKKTLVISEQMKDKVVQYEQESIKNTRKVRRYFFKRHPQYGT